MERRQKPVDVIAVCRADGTIQPLRLRLEDGEQCYVRGDVVEILRTSEIPYVGIEAKIYQCRVRIEDRICYLELRYAIRSHTWCLQRRTF